MGWQSIRCGKRGCEMGTNEIGITDEIIRGELMRLMLGDNFQAGWARSKLAGWDFIRWNSKEKRYELTEKGIKFIGKEKQIGIEM